MVKFSHIVFVIVLLALPGLLHAQNTIKGSAKTDSTTQVKSCFNQPLIIKNIDPEKQVKIAESQMPKAQNDTLARYVHQFKFATYCSLSVSKNTKTGRSI
jgi:hypothetical protein